MQCRELYKVIDVIEEHKVSLLGDWLSIESVVEIFDKYTISVEYFRDNYAYGIFQYYLDVVREVAKIGRCPSMDKFLMLLIDKNIAPHEIYTLCTYFRRSLLDFSFDKLPVSKNLVSEITYITDLNLNSVLARYEEIINLKNKHFDSQSLILKQHKNVVDISAIVSKTDKNGVITYVNDNFCAISGYTKEELLGQPHNITRHDDVSSQLFENLWMTIQSKQSWHGEIKNYAKNGDYYIVSTYIMPILDADGEIEEYISVRYDVTELYKLQEEIEETQREIVYKMGTISEKRSEETGNHVKRVASYSKVLGREYGLSSEEVDLLYQASPMHDIGKVGIPDSILNKPGKLTDEEFSIMKTHSDIGYKMFNTSSRPLLNLVSIIAREHHEKWDGSGYPRSLRGEDISIYGRITALADVFDALGSDRVYKKAWDDKKLFSFLKAQSGKHFDPHLVEIFFNSLDEMLEIREAFKD